MVKIITWISVAVLFSANMAAQSVLIERDLENSVYVKKKGPDKNRFFHLYYDLSYFATDAETPYDNQYCYRNFVGARRYYRLAKSYIMGVNLEFGWENFRVKQDNQKTFPTTGEHKKELIGTTNLGLEYFNRLLVTRKEGSLGIWLDAGAYGNITLGSRHVVKNKAAATSEVKYQKIINRGLKYLNPWEYGVKARLGYKRYAVLGTYRLSDWMAKSYSGYEPPRLSLGFELGFY